MIFATYVIKGHIGNNVYDHIISSKVNTGNKLHISNEKVQFKYPHKSYQRNISSHSPACPWWRLWRIGTDLYSLSGEGTHMHVLVSIYMCPCECDKERIASQKVWGQGFHQRCSHQHQYTSNLKQSSADVMGDLYGIRPATLVTDQPGKKHAHTNLMGGHQHRPTPALIA